MLDKPVIDHTIDPLHPFRPSTIGPFRETVQVGGKQRRYICYLPADLRASTSGVFVFGADGVTAEQLMAESSWCELADTEERKEKFIVFFLEPEDGVWHPEDPAEDLAYVHAVYMASRARDKYVVHEAKYYLVGYGAGGTIAQMAAMDDPAVYAGVASVDAPEVPEAFIAKNGAAPCTSLNGYEDTDGRYGYKKSDFTVPAWIISSDPAEQTAARGAARYWRTCAGTCDSPRQVRPDTWEYYRTEPALWTVNQEKEAFRVWVSQMTNASAGHGYLVNRLLWAGFLRDVRRWMAEPGGDLRMTRDPVTDLGMEYHYELIDGWMREYYVYVPTWMRQGYDEPVPLVFAMHGYSCSGEIYAGNSEWYKLAEEKGFVVVFPSAAHGHLRSDDPNNPAVGPDDTELPAWNLMDLCPVAPDELVFFETMVERVCAAHKIDRSRIFATGHSLGSMMTQYLGLARPEMFAAIAPCSGVLFLNRDAMLDKPQVKQRADVQLPVWMFGGEREEWLLPAVPVTDNATGKTIRVWWDLDHLPGEKPTDFEAFRQPDKGRWKDYIFPDGAVPMVRYTWVEAMPHATMTEMSWRIWDEFFSKIHRQPDGSVAYEG